MTNNIESIIESLNEKRKKDDEIARLSFSRIELTEDEKKTIESMKRDDNKIVTVITTDDLGHRVEVDSETYIKEMEKHVMSVQTENGAQFRILDPYDLSEFQDIQNSHSEFKALGLKSLNKLTDKQISDDIFDELGYKISSAISERFKDMDIGDALNQLRRYPLRSIIDMMPKEFLDMFYSSENPEAEEKDRVLAAINYLIMSGPEIDKFQEYVSYEHHKINVIKDLMERGMEIHKLITSPDSIAKIHAEYVQGLSQSPKLPIIQKVRNANSIETTYNELSVIYEKMAEAYRRLLDDPAYSSDEYAKQCIHEEIELNETKSRFYKDSLTLSEFSDKLDSFLAERKGRYTLNLSQLSKLAKKVIKRIQYANLDIPFPGYYPEIKNDPEVIYETYLNWFCDETTGAFTLYNAAVDKIHERGMGTFIKANPQKYELMATLMLIVTWRICKKYTKNNSPILHRLYLESYFKMICMLKTDLFIMGRFIEIFENKIK